MKFVVQKAAEAQSESIKQVVPAHKFVLSISSPVFEAMFYGELAETTDSVELPDCEYDSESVGVVSLHTPNANMADPSVVARDES